MARFTADPESLIRTLPSFDTEDVDGEMKDLDQSTDDVGERRASFKFDMPTSFKMALSTRSAQRQTFFNDPQSFSEKTTQRRVNVKSWR